MKIKALGICPPPSAKENPAVTPELLASVLARYSRSNKGIDEILDSIDWQDPESSVDRIFKFIDYGHASIAGMTGGIPVVVDGCSMYLAYKIFEIAQLCDGQESSTRYIKMESSNLPEPSSIGIPESVKKDWYKLMDLCFKCYRDTYNLLDNEIKKNPSLISLPENIDNKVAERLYKNYALDRARYFIPFATKTNAAYIMSGRVWAETIKQLSSLPLPEAKECAEGLRKELSKFIPRLLKHSYPDHASNSQTMQTFNLAIAKMLSDGINIDKKEDAVFIAVENNFPPFLSNHQNVKDAFEGKENRYSTVGPYIKRIMVRVAWNNISIAELRDLNRHRSGYRFTPLYPEGFYLPPGIEHPQKNEMLLLMKSIIENLIKEPSTASLYLYCLPLGIQVAYEHSTHLDKFIYEIELRTGAGAHFRYAEHLRAAYFELIKRFPELKDFIKLGTAEPE